MRAHDGGLENKMLNVISCLCSLINEAWSSILATVQIVLDLMLFNANCQMVLSCSYLTTVSAAAAKIWCVHRARCFCDLKTDRPVPARASSKAVYWKRNTAVTGNMWRTCFTTTGLCLKPVHSIWTAYGAHRVSSTGRDQSACHLRPAQSVQDQFGITKRSSFVGTNSAAYLRIYRADRQGRGRKRLARRAHVD